jgi:hypothetical protein
MRQYVCSSPIATELMRRNERPLCANRDLTRCSKEALFDHLIGKREQRRRHGNAECLCGCEVNDEVKLRRLLDRDVGRLLAF